MPSSYSQLGQDLAVIEFYKHKKCGFFLEIGASDGIRMSNTKLLEDQYGWTGICAEPIPDVFLKLKANRPKSICVNEAVYSTSGLKLSFDTALSDTLFSGLTDTLTCHRKLVDSNKRTINVETISLTDLLDQNNAPCFIEYMSLDTEGSEYEILKSFDFHKYTFGLIDVEHNYKEPIRSMIRELLISKGYVYLRENKWDDCYVHSSVSYHIHQVNNCPFLFDTLNNMKQGNKKVAVLHRLDNKQLNDPDSFTVYITSEPDEPPENYNLCIVPFTSSNTKSLYYPFLYMALSEMRKTTFQTGPKPHFCAFMYYRDYEHRNKIFRAINEYKPVDCLGHACGGTKDANTRYVYNNNETMYDVAVEVYSKYKFVISVENCYKDGYFTEKILLPILAKSIPIYWGHPKVFDYINKNRVIYLPDYDYDSLFKKLDVLLTNDEEYERVVNEPVYTDIGNPNVFNASFTSGLKTFGLTANKTDIQSSSQ